MEWTEAETIQAVTKIKRIVILITKSMTIALDVVSMRDACYTADHPLLQSVMCNSKFIRGSACNNDRKLYF